ncbi:DUF3224 domain-containing protein [Pelomonas sp. CA6]|mgnify:CR=1 FL=1|uniref:DUF3224 domain-containing protein n=1 Tax=Pelomonas sp. CA6 TaxID=2907999 RepID=UPI001F4BDB1A|nr:DUF3224 domain-containing protein [Pelomonas sp. CA6]MCH7345679.1 DUF3224 domain-containing protein [Pelomonas sp. CA6]
MNTLHLLRRHLPGLGALFWSASAMSTPASSATSAAPLRCSGQFKVRLLPPEAMDAPPGAPAMARRKLEKSFEGGLQGQSLGEMLAAGLPPQGEAAYVALESFTGTLDGRPGGFAMAHLGLMHAGGQSLRIAIVPGSGSGALAGITGELTLRIAAGVHHYELAYALPASASSQ